MSSTASLYAMPTKLFRKFQIKKVLTFLVVVLIREVTIWTLNFSVSHAGECLDHCLPGSDAVYFDVWDNNSFKT